MTTHDLKVWPDFFSAIDCGEKPFEVRKNDRDYRVATSLVRVLSGLVLSSPSRLLFSVQTRHATNHLFRIKPEPAAKLVRVG